MDVEPLVMNGIECVSVERRADRYQSWSVKVKNLATDEVFEVATEPGTHRPPPFTVGARYTLLIVPEETIKSE